MGPKAIHSTVLNTEEEAMVVTFRRHTLLPLDDCLLRTAGLDPASDQIVASPMFATPWH